MDLSIIIPSYNVEKYILKCLTSIENLENISYEIIVINDGSTDNTCNIIDEFCKKYHGDVQVINQRNAGLSNARNIGLSLARGDYICFLDSDDYVYGEKLVELVLQVKKDNLDIGFGDYQKYINNHFEQVDTVVLRKKLLKENNPICSGIEYAERVFDKRKNFIISEVCFAIFSNRFVRENSLKFKEGIYHEDTLFFYESIVKAKRVKYYSIEFYIYNIRERSITTNKENSKKSSEDKFFIAGELLKIKEKNKLSTYFIDSYIINLYFYSIVKCRVINEYDLNVLELCKNLTIRSRLMYFIMKLRR